MNKNFFDLSPMDWFSYSRWNEILECKIISNDCTTQMIFYETKTPGYTVRRSVSYETLQKSSFVYLGKKNSVFSKILTGYEFKKKNKLDLNIWSIDNKQFLEEIKDLEIEQIKTLSENLAFLKLEVDKLLIDKI